MNPSNLSSSPHAIHLAGLLLLLSAAASARAEVFELFPTGMTSDCNEELENVWNAAQPGDEIVLNAGVYAQGCRRAISVNGTAEQPIVVRAADGADVLVTRPEASSTQHNNIEIAGSYLIIRGLRFQYGGAGVTFLGGSHHITFEDNEVFDTYDNALRLNSGDTDSFIIRNNEIHRTGLGGSTGEGMYVGCHNGNCVASNHLIEGNYIHDLESQSGGGNDGIEIKYRSHSNVIRGNTIHNTVIGQDFPCIFVYGHGDGAPNVIENNFVYDCGEAILVTADAIVRNNVVLDSTVNGIHINRQSPAPSVRNVTVVNNTVHGTHPVCARLNVGAASGVIVANNAFYCAGSTAISGALGAATITNNYVAGSMASGSVDGAAFHAGGSAGNAFVDPAGRDFRLAVGSVLIDAGDGTVPDLPALDYDGNVRVAGAGIDVGAFEFDAGVSAPPSVTLDVVDATLVVGEVAQLSWTVADADACTAGSDPPGAWDGAIPPSDGSLTIADLQADVILTLSCSNAGGSTTRSVTVSVTAPVDYVLHLDDDGDTSAGSVPLDGAGALSGTVYVAVLPEQDIDSVRFQIDGNGVGGTQQAAPFLLGGDQGFDTSTLTDGTHALTAQISTGAGDMVTLTASLAIDNLTDAAPPPDPEPDPVVDDPPSSSSGGGAAAPLVLALLAALGIMRARRSSPVGKHSGSA